MKESGDKDWFFAFAMTALAILALVLAILDPSCQRRNEEPGSHSIRTQ